MITAVPDRCYSCCKVSYLSILTTDCSWAELGSQAAPRRSLLQAATTAATKDQMSEREEKLPAVVTATGATPQ